MKGVSLNLFCLIFLFALVSFSFNVYAEETYLSEVTVEINPDVAGITPDSFFYFIDITHTPEEALAEAGLMAEAGDVESTQEALQNFADAIESEKEVLEELDVSQVTMETLTSDTELMQLYEEQANLLEYQLYVDYISDTLEENAEQTETSIVQEAVSVGEDSIVDVGSTTEDKTSEVIETVALDNEIPQIEVEFVLEEQFQQVAIEEYPETSLVFEEITNELDIQEVKDEIVEVRTEVGNLDESNMEVEDVANELLDMAEIEVASALYAEESNLDINAEIHLNSAEDFLITAEELVNGEISLSLVEEDVGNLETLSEEIQAEILDEQKDAEVFIENYPELQEKYANDPEKLAVIESEIGDIKGGGSFRYFWNYDYETNKWILAQTGDVYDPVSGKITHPDGTVINPEEENNNDGTCYSCYLENPEEPTNEEQHQIVEGGSDPEEEGPGEGGSGGGNTEGDY